MVYFLTEGTVDYVEEAMDRVNDFFNVEDREFFKDSAASSQSMDFEKEDRLRLKELNRGWVIEPYRSENTDTGGRSAVLKKVYKTAVRKMTSWFIGDMAKQQMDFNSNIVAYLNFQHDHAFETPQNFPGSWYMNFEKKFGRTGPERMKQLHRYVSYFQKSDSSRLIVDLGCGKGDFLGCLSKAGIGAQGTDLSPAMVKYCSKKGYDVKRKDVVVYLREFHDNSLGGIFSSRLVETMERSELSRLIRFAYRKLEKGGRLIFETSNPRSLANLSGNFYKDPENKWPLDPDALSFLLEQAGFNILKLEYLNEFSPEETLQITDDMNKETRALTEELNRRFYGPKDYYIVCSK